MAGRELKALLNSGEQGATYTATISIAGATVELPPEQRKCFSDDKHPFTATSFDFLACVVVRKCVSPSLQEAVKVVPSNVVADIVAGREATHVAFDGLVGCKMVAFCIWSGEVSDKKASNAGMLLLLRPDHLGLDATAPWKTRFVRVCHPTPAAEHLAAVDQIVKWFHGRVCLYYGNDSVQCVRAGQLGEPTRLVDLDISSWKAPCGSLACGFAFDRVLNDLDAVVGHEPAPRIAKPIARTLTTLRQDAKRAGKELAFRSRCGIADGHGGDAHGGDREKSHEQPAGSHVSGRDNVALNTALALTNTGEGDQGKPDNKEEGSSSDREEDAAVNAQEGGGDGNAEEEADEGEGYGRDQDEGDAAEDDQRGDLELEGSDEMDEEDKEEDEEEEEEVEEVAATHAGRPTGAVAGAGKSIRGLQAVLSPRPGSATHSGEYAGKSPVLGKRKHAELVKMAPEKLAAEILRLNQQLENQKRKLDEVASTVPGAEFAVVITQKYEDLEATVEKALTHARNTELVVRREAKLAAKDRSENRDMREVLKRAAVRLEDCAGSMKGVVVDSMENAQKKLTDEVARKIDGASSNIAGTAEKAIHTSGVTSSLNIMIAMLSGRAAPQQVPVGTQGQVVDEVAANEGGNKAADKESGKKVADKETGKRVADKETGKCESSRGGKWQKGVAIFSVVDLLKKGGAVVDRAAGSTWGAAAAAAGPPPATSGGEAGKGKAKVEDGPPASTTTPPAITTAIVPASGYSASVAPGQPGPSSIAPAIPPSADVKAKNQRRSGCKPPAAAVKTERNDDDSDADDEVEMVLQRLCGPGDTSGAGGKRKGCGIRPPPRGGEGMVGEPWLGGRRRWLGHHSLQEVQYLTAIAVMCYDKKIDPGLKLTAQQKSEWAEDISAAGTLCTGLFTTMHLRNLCGNVDRYHHMFKTYRDLTRRGSPISNTIAWAAAVGKEAADEEPDVTGAQVGLFAGAVACAVAMVWETCNGSELETVADAGYSAAQLAGTPEEMARGHATIVTAVFNRARKENERKQAPEVTPKVIAEKIETSVVNRLGARLGDPTMVAMVAHEAVDVLMTWCDCKIAAKTMEANGLYLALPEKRLSVKKRSA
ncbi:unnamed protein product [Closterium sp. Yama58-4]|nr:unnamed protein product [Closterium sp. Yama58-4]